MTTTTLSTRTDSSVTNGIVQLVIGPFRNPITGIDSDYVFPALDDIDLSFTKDGQELSTINGYLVPFNEGTYKFLLNTANMSPGMYEFTATAEFADTTTQIKGRFELVEIDSLGYFIWRVRYMLFDWIASKYHLDFWKEGVKWNDYQIIVSIENALDAINGKGGRDLGYGFETLPRKFFGTLITGAMYYALMSRSIFEVAERHEYSDEVTLTINRDYSTAIANLKAEFDERLLDVQKQRPRPMSLRSPIFWTMYHAHVLALPVSVYSFAYTN